MHAREFPKRKATYLHLTIDSIASTDGSTAAAKASAVTPFAASLAIRAITSHVTSITTDTTNDVGSEVALFGTVVLAMSNLTT